MTQMAKEMYVCARAHVYGCACVRVRMCVGACTCVWVHVCVHTHTYIRIQMG